MTIFKLRYEFVYVGGRLVALASRPLMLLVVNYLGGNDLAALMAVVFLVTMLATAVSAFDTHRGFYQAYFGSQRSSGLQSFYKLYFGATTLQVAIVSPFLAVSMLYRFEDPALAVLVSLYFASERLADEAQRFLIFNGQRQEWGVRMTAKVILQLAGVSASAALQGPVAAQAAVGFLLVGNLTSYGYKFQWRYMPAKMQIWKTVAAACLKQWLFWLLSLATTFISYLDRLLVMLFQQSDMATYTILVSCMSIVQSAVDYFFVSMRRRDILQGQLRLTGIFLNRFFCLTLGIAALVGCVASWVTLRIYDSQHIQHLELFPIVLLSQSTMSITLVMREIIYWNYSIGRLVWVEGVFILCTLASLLIMQAMGQGLEVVLGMVSVVLTLRMGFMIWIIARLQNHISKI